MMKPHHNPVLFKQVVQFSQCQAGDTVIDTTVGFGGHGGALIECILPKGRFLGLDKDDRAIRYCREHFRYPGVEFAQGWMSDLAQIARDHQFEAVDVLLIDLGVSSLQLDDPKYGISFRALGPLDMRIGHHKYTETAWEIVNRWPREKLKRLFTEHGLWRTNRLINRLMTERQKQSINRIEDFVAIIEETVPKKPGLHPATQIFQALRWQVNHEDEELKRGLEQAVTLLKKGGRLLIISFHSLEDRIVKQFMTGESKDCLCPPEVMICRCGHKANLRLLMKKPIVPSADEKARNPRSRSAKMRVAEII